MSTPKGDGTFNVYDDVRNKLVARGIPKEEIAFIHEYNTEAKKAELFAKVRAGPVSYTHLQKTEERITEWQEHLRELNIRKKQLEDAEIIKSIRSMKLNSRELLVVLDKIQNGTAVFPYLTEETTVPDTKKEEDWKDIAEERKLPGHRAEEKEDEHRENEN